MINTAFMFFIKEKCASIAYIWIWAAALGLYTVLNKVVFGTQTKDYFFF